jgi:hypothetical protein
MAWWPAVVGVLFLFLGRRLYWLFVGAIGFLAGEWLATNLTHRQPDLTALLFGLVAGLVGILLALLLQRLAIVVAGFLAGAWLGAELAGALGSPSPGTPWLPALIGGVIGAVLSAALFDAILVVLSSLVGAALVAKLLGGSLLTQGIVFIVLTLLGIAVQAGAKRRKASRDDRRPAVRP